jgi:molybdopterin converting factor small subunit
MAKIRIKTFGKVAEILGASEFEWEYALQTDTLCKELEDKFPKLKNSQYLLAVNKKIITSNCPLGQHDEIAFLSPFSGG